MKLSRFHTIATQERLEPHPDDVPVVKGPGTVVIHEGTIFRPRRWQTVERYLPDMEPQGPPVVIGKLTRRPVQAIDSKKVLESEAQGRADYFKYQRRNTEKLKGVRPGWYRKLEPEALYDDPEERQPLEHVAGPDKPSWMKKK